MIGYICKSVSSDRFVSLLYSYILHVCIHMYVHVCVSERNNNLKKWNHARNTIFTNKTSFIMLHPHILFHTICVQFLFSQRTRKYDGLRNGTKCILDSTCMGSTVPQGICKLVKEEEKETTGAKKNSGKAK